MPNNSIQKGVVLLKINFDRDDMYKGKIVVDQYEDVIEINIGVENNPRMTTICKNTTLNERRNIA